MKKYWIALLMLFSLATMASFAFAYPKNSVLFESTAGMFEDDYDNFLDTPAYLPSLGAGTLWTQLFTVGELNTFLLGGQADLGFGHLGGLFDGTETGDDYSDQDDTVIQQDTDFDSIFDLLRNEEYTIEDRSYATTQNIYIPFGTEVGLGFDLGVALRGAYTADQSNANNISTRIDYDTIAGLWPIYRYEYKSESENKETSSESGLVVGILKRQLTPNLDMYLNIEPMIQQSNQTITSSTYSYTDYEPGDPATTNDRTVNNNRSFDKQMPGDGITLQLDADYYFDQSLLLSTTLDYQGGQKGITLRTADDTTNISVNRYPSGGFDYIDSTTTLMSNVYDEDREEASEFGVQMRLRHYGENWKLGGGFKFLASTQKNWDVERYQYQSTSVRSGRPLTSLNYIAVSTSGYQRRNETNTYNQVFEFPVGLVIDIVEKFPFYFGAKHLITLSETKEIVQYSSSTPLTTTTTYENGTIILTSTNYHSVTDSETITNELEHTTQYYAGFSWFPVDAVAIQAALMLGNNLIDYQASFTFMF